MKNFLESPKTKAILWILGGAIALLVVFAIGTLVGYRRAIFASHWGQNYYQNFNEYGGPPGSMMGRAPLGLHGVTGEVIDVTSGTMAVKDPSGNEQSVQIDPDTTVRGRDQAVSFSDVQVGSWVTVIGGPNDTGQIEARFVRVFDSSSALPVDFNQ